MTDRFEDLIRFWRETVKNMTPREHWQATEQCPSLAALDAHVACEAPEKLDPRLGEHLKGCLYCQKRVHYLKKNAPQEQSSQELSVLDVLAADVSVAEATRYHPVSVALVGDGLETDHQCLIRVDWEGSDTVYITIVVPQEIRTFKDIWLARKHSTAHSDLFRIYIAKDRSTVVAMGKGISYHAATLLEDLRITFQF